MVAAIPVTTARRTDLGRIGPVVALVVAAHALMLSIPRQAPMASGSSSSSTQAVQFRVIDLPSAPAALPAMVASDEDAPRRTLAPLPAFVTRATAPIERTELLRSPPPSEVAGMPPAQNWLGLSLPGVATDDDRFFARSLLTVVPAPLQPVMIDYPAFAGDAGRYVSQLSLFIDETGVVVKVRVDGDPLPPPLEAAARSAFLSARFRPGEVAEHGAVKSRIRIEVTFDSREAPRGG